MLKIQIEKKKIIEYIIIFTICFSTVVLAHVSNTLYKLIIVFLISAIILFEIRKSETLKKVQYHIVSFVLFTAWTWLSIIWSNYNEGHDSQILFTLFCFVIVSIYLYCQSLERIIIAIKCFIASSVFLAVFISSFYGFESIIAQRMSNDLLNSNDAGIIFATGCFFSIFIFNYQKRISYIFIALMLGFFTLLSGSKGSLFSLMIYIGIFFVFKDTSRKIKMFRNVIIASLLLMIMYYSIMNIPFLYDLIGYRTTVFLNSFLGNNVDITSYTSTGMRLYFYIEAWKCFINSPILGVGWANFAHYNMYNAYSHSNIMELLSNLGAVGVILYYYPYFVMLKKSIFLLRHKESDKVMIAFVLAYVMHLLTYSFMAIYYNEMWQLIVLCLTGSIIQIEEERMKANWQLQAMLLNNKKLYNLQIHERQIF